MAYSSCEVSLILDLEECGWSDSLITSEISKLGVMFSLQNDTFLAVMRGERDSLPPPNLSAVGSTLRALAECLHDVTATILDQWWAELRSRVAMIRFYDQFG